MQSSEVVVVFAFSDDFFPSHLSLVLVLVALYLLRCLLVFELPFRLVLHVVHVHDELIGAFSHSLRGYDLELLGEQLLCFFGSSFSFKRRQVDLVARVLRV